MSTSRFCLHERIDLAHYNGYSMGLSIAEYRQDIAFNCLAVYGYGCNTLANVIRILYGDVISCTTELSGNCEAIPFVRNGRINLQTVPIRNKSLYKSVGYVVYYG